MNWQMEIVLRRLLSLVLIILAVSEFSFSQVTNDGPPPHPPSPPGSLDLKMEVDSLSQNREERIYKLIDRISNSCIQNDSDMIIVQLNVNPQGEIDNFYIAKSDIFDPNVKEKIFKCVSDALSQESLMLGELKVIPNAINGSHVRSVPYTFSIKK